MGQEGQIPLQSDQLSLVAGGPIRTIIATIPINGIPTQVQMQVVAIANADGIFEDQQNPYINQIQFEILTTLKDIRRIVAQLAGIPSF